VGNNTITITVTAEDGTTTKIYPITVVRAASNDATLKSLTVSNGDLSPAFAASVIEYTVNVANDVTAITVTGVANHAEARVDGNVTGKTLVVGNNTVAITVTAEDGTTTKTYTVTVVRAAPLTGVEISNVPQAHVYPNPTDDMVTLEFETAGEYVISVSDMTGKILLHQTVNDITVRLDLSHFSTGVYLLIINDGKRQNTMRIVKN